MVHGFHQISLADAVQNRIVAQRHLQLFAQGRNMHPDGVAEAVHAAVPHMLHQLLLTHRPPLIQQQVFQNPVFLPGQGHGLAVDLCRPLHRVEGDPPAAQQRVVLHEAASGQAAYPGLQLLQMKGLDQIVVGAAIQPLYLIADPAAGGENQHPGLPIPFPQRPKQLHAVPAGQVQIQQDQIVFLRQHPFQRGLAVIADVRFISFSLQALGQRVAQRPLILHNQDSHTGPPLFSSCHAQYSIRA